MLPSEDSKTIRMVSQVGFASGLVKFREMNRPKLGQEREATDLIVTCPEDDWMADKIGDFAA